LAAETGKEIKTQLIVRKPIRHQLWLECLFSLL